MLIRHIVGVSACLGIMIGAVTYRPDFSAPQKDEGRVEQEVSGAVSFDNFLTTYCGGVRCAATDPRWIKAFDIYMEQVPRRF